MLLVGMAEGLHSGLSTSWMVCLGRLRRTRLFWEKMRRRDLLPGVPNLPSRSLRALTPFLEREEQGWEELGWEGWEEVGWEEWEELGWEEWEELGWEEWEEWEGWEGQGWEEWGELEWEEWGEWEGWEELGWEEVGWEG